MKGGHRHRTRTLGPGEDAPPSTFRAHELLESGERAPTSATTRTTIDTILQSSTVALFHAHGLAVAPLGSSPVGTQQRYYDWVGLIGFDGPSFSGTLTLSIPTPLYEMHAENRDPSDRTTLEDFCQEMVNQLLGRIKNRLTMFQVQLKSHLPSTLSGVALERLRKRTPLEVLYRFRALRGDIIVTLDAPLDNNLLSYSGNAQVIKEGDVVLF